uniref:Fanconi Anaemia group E protein C-terminal domain-containing protein n=1 Tax=Coccolithus braarudii TaxID=221442 RepID=A0A7S0L5G1_9EUKA|mmetsp:Transcript_21558/g.46398  ORF Transcript_21558/g.46398 Transcript_21558/m.46398 type:complete len:400 (+) Transcript_21558:232-1431(+)
MPMEGVEDAVKDRQPAGATMDTLASRLLDRLLSEQGARSKYDLFDLVSHWRDVEQPAAEQPVAVPDHGLPYTGTKRLREVDGSGAREGDRSLEAALAATQPVIAASPLTVAEGTDVHGEAAASANAHALPADTAAELIAAHETETLLSLGGLLADTGRTEEERVALAAAPILQLMEWCSGSTERASAALGVLRVDELPEGGLVLLAKSFGAAECPGHASALFARAAVLPRLRALVSPASRALFNSISALAAQQPSMVLDELLMPLLWTADGELSAAQSELLGRLAKELPKPAVGRLVEAFARGEASEPQAWSEAQVAVVQGALALRPSISPETVRQLLQQADANVDTLRKSLKFSNLLFTLVRSYGDQLGPHVTLARAVAEQLETFMRKTTLSALARLG